MRRVIKPGLTTQPKFSFILKGVLEKEDIKVTEKASGSKKQTRKKSKGLDESPQDRELHILEKRILKIPNVVFVDENGLAIYPPTTDKHCFNDHYPFDWAPCGVPVRTFIIGKDTYYVCVKIECSLECALLTYNTLYFTEPRKYAKTRKLLEQLNEKMCAALGKPYIPLQPALDPNLLQVVGSGDMHIDEYRNNCQTRYMSTETVKLVQGQEIYYKI